MTEYDPYVVCQPDSGQGATIGQSEIDWCEVARLLLVSRRLDELEERELVPAGAVTYQFSARGHELAQIVLATQLNHPHDAATVYYRSRPFVLASGLSIEEALLASLARRGSPTGGRDIGVVHNLPSRGRATVLPMSGDVGSQYTPAVGWAQALCYRQQVLNQHAWKGAVAVTLGGDGSVATPGFWVALNAACTRMLPVVFFIEDNDYAISVPSKVQIPGGNIVANLAAYHNLTLLDGDGTDPLVVVELVQRGLAVARAGDGPVLIRMHVPRLNGHSFTDTQRYKDQRTIADEWARDPLPRVRALLLELGWSAHNWRTLEQQVEADIQEARQRAEACPVPNPTTSTHFVFAEPDQPQQVGGMHARAQVDVGPVVVRMRQPVVADPQGPPVRINMIDAIRQTLADGLRELPQMLIFGEDVGQKGGVHGVTVGLQQQFGAERVFDTPLAEEGIIGRALGLAYSGLLPVPEIQFRKYADPAMEHLTDCGTIRWRTNNRFAAPIVVRIPVGFSKHTGDPWHSVSGEAIFAHLVGWQIIFPSNAADAAGLLRCALHGNDPVFFLEHRALLDAPTARSVYPGDGYTLPLGRAALKQAGDTLTVVTWGAMVQRCVEAAEPFAQAVEIIDLRTIVPWDRETVLASVRKTGRCLIVHEDTWTGGFGAEIAATIVQEAFEWLDAPVTRVATPDCPVPYSRELMDTVVPTVARLRAKLDELLRY